MLESFEQSHLPYDKEHAMKLLDTKLNDKWIEQRKQGNTMLSYIGGHIVIRLLNKAFDGAWSFEILEETLIDSLPKPRTKWEKQNGKNVKVPELDKDGNQLFDYQPPYIRVKGRMTVPGMGVKEQYGTKVLIGGATEQEHASKAAATDALKKCASLYGVGLELYGDADGLIEGYHNINEYVTEEPVEFASEEKPAAVKETTSATPKPAPAKATPAPATNSIESPKEVSAPANTVSWKPEDVQELRSLKEQLGVEENAQLDAFMIEYFQDPEATYRDVTPTNIKEINDFLRTKIVPAQ